VQSWLATPSSSNFGIVIANPGGATDGVDLYSREHQTATQRPKLSILYTPAPTPSMPGDFNLDDVIDDADIDMLFAAIAAGSADSAFNVDGVGSVDRQDVDFLVREILGTEYGDANLDGSVDGIDFGIWDSHKFQSGTGWVLADFNGDGSTDGTDFNLWNQFRFANGPAVASSVPRTPRAPLNTVSKLSSTVHQNQPHRASGRLTTPTRPEPWASAQRLMVLRKSLLVHTTTGDRSGDSGDERSAESHVADFESRAFNAVRYIRLIHEPRTRPRDKEHRERDVLFGLLSEETKETDVERR